MSPMPRADSESRAASSAATPYTEGEFDFRGAAGQITELPFCPADLPSQIAKKLRHARYGWLTTVASSGIPMPMLVWFLFDGHTLTVYSQPPTARVRHVLDRPEVSLHLDSDGVGSGLLIVGGRAALTAEGVDPRDDSDFWAKYHVEAEAVGLSEAISTYSAKISITPTTLWTTYDA